MHKQVAKILGIIVALLAIIGFFIEGEHLFGVMNVDLAMDIARTVLAIALLYVGFGPATNAAARLVVALVGGVYIVMAVVTFIDPMHFGLLNTEFTGFDVGFHLVVGALAVILALVPARERDRDRAADRLDPRT